VIDCEIGHPCIFFPAGRRHGANDFRAVASPEQTWFDFDQERQPLPSDPPARGAAKDSQSIGAAPNAQANNGPPGDDGFKWWPALGQSLFFLGIEHGIRFAFDPPTRRHLNGKFWKDYVKSVKSLKTWGDNNPAFINYLGHPMQGAITSYIQIHNDPKGKDLVLSSSRAYWISRMKSMAWSAGYSAFFEIGFPISEAAVGNLGIGARPPEAPKMGYVDLVITPLLGTVWVVAEDAVDLYLVRLIERKTTNPTLRAIARGVLNPMRSVANVMRFKHPWHRDGVRP
jgi:hypothetical protein